MPDNITVSTRDWPITSPYYIQYIVQQIGDEKWQIYQLKDAI